MGCWRRASTDVVKALVGLNAMHDISDPQEDSQSLASLAEGAVTAEDDFSSVAVEAHATAAGQLDHTQDAVGGVGIGHHADDLLVELATDGVDEDAHVAADHWQDSGDVVAVSIAATLL